jgi:hypothetical protein
MISSSFDKIINNYTKNVFSGILCKLMFYIAKRRPAVWHAVSSIWKYGWQSAELDAGFAPVGTTWDTAFKRGLTTFDFGLCKIMADNK